MCRTIHLLFVTAALSALAACKCSEASKENEQMSTTPAYVQLAHDRFGDNAEFMENVTGEFVLVVSRTVPDQINPYQTASFFVFGKEEGEVTYESEIIGSVNWLDEHHLEVVILPRVVKADSEGGGITYRVDVRTGSRVELTTSGRR